MDKYQKNAVELYQCVGCIKGCDISCFEESFDLRCKNHRPGTIITQAGTIFLGMPKGFNRLGPCEVTKLNIFKTIEDSWGYDEYNVPVWKYLDEHNHTIVRGLCPRINYPFIHIFLENCMDKIDCLEITNKDLDNMD